MTQVETEPVYEYAVIEASAEPIPDGWERDTTKGSEGLHIENGQIIAAHYRRPKRRAISI